MPGDYGPGGKWIHERAHRIMEQTGKQYGEDKGKQVAYALATQEAHKVGKSPKDFRTAKGVVKAKKKFHKPQEEYKKTAGVLTPLLDDAFLLAYRTSPEIRRQLSAMGVKGEKPKDKVGSFTDELVRIDKTAGSRHIGRLIRKSIERLLRSRTH